MVQNSRKRDEEEEKQNQFLCNKKIKYSENGEQMKKEIKTKSQLKANEFYLS